MRSTPFRCFVAGVFSIFSIFSAGCAGATDGTGPTVTYYLHWNCGGQAQCAADFGSNTGIQVTYTVLTTCIAQMITFANNNTIQEWNGHVGTWCDNVSNPSETAPAPGF
jgi:uncharacterized membrane protein